MGNAKETDCHSPLRGFAMTDTENANLRGMEPPITDRCCDNSFIHCRFPRASSETEPVFPARNISVGARADRRRCAAGDDRKQKPSARRGVDRKAGRFSSPRLRVLLWSFLLTREESGVPETEERTINSPANPQICRRRAIQGTRIAASLRSSGWRMPGMLIGAEWTSSDLPSLDYLPQVEGVRMRIQTNFFLTQPVLHGKIAYPVRVF